MKTIKKISMKYAGKKFSLLILLPIVGFVAGWYVAVRVISPWQVVKIIELKTKDTEVLPAAETFDTLRVGCYNIAHGRGGKLGSTNWKGGNRATKTKRIKQIGQLLNEAQLDIIVLNEVDFSSFWSGHLDQAQAIAQEAGYPYIVEQRNIDVAIPFVSLRFGNAILSKYPISETVFLDYPHPSKTQEILVGGFKDGVAATVTLPDGKQIQVAAVHLSLEGEAYRDASVKMILDLQQHSQLPMIAMGDFNSTASGYPAHHTGPAGQNSIDTLMANPSLSTQPHGLPVNPKDFTFPSEKPVRVIDWIFTSSHWRIQEKNVIESTLSDHLPVTVTLSKNTDLTLNL
ncbi:MAG: endonuclease/exonuclease/phosphatase family protein [Planctomycetota bacterium]|jgi:endonuclease/exonuclease/phosphatase family metal-dependent hydrolase